jgi:hypothetical protein
MLEAHRCRSLPFDLMISLTRKNRSRSARGGWIILSNAYAYGPEADNPRYDA